MAIQNLGSQVDAQRALSNPSNKMGSGAFRAAYANAAQTLVYKLAHDISEDEQNIVEYQHAIRAQQRGVQGIPNVGLQFVNGRPIVVMPLIPNSGHAGDDDMQRDAFESWDAAGFADIKPDNCRVDDNGEFWLTDLQFYICGIDSHRRSNWAFSQCTLRNAVTEDD